MFECLLASKIPANKDEKKKGYELDTSRCFDELCVLNCSTRYIRNYSSIVRSNNLRERFSGLSILGQTIQPAPPTHISYTYRYYRARSTE